MVGAIPGWYRSNPLKTMSARTRDWDPAAKCGSILPISLTWIPNRRTFSGSTGSALFSKVAFIGLAGKFAEASVLSAANTPLMATRQTPIQMTKDIDGFIIAF